MESTKKNEQTSQKQFAIMIDFMKNLTDLAKSKLKENDAKQPSHILWKRLADMLDAEGPTMRSVKKWKKVWSDYKTHLKAKMRKNKSSVSGTGGGPSRFCPLTPLEEEVCELMNMGESIEGHSEIMAFGVRHPNREFPTEQAPTTEAAKDCYITDDVNDITQSIESPIPSISARSRLTTKSLLEKQVENQMDYHENSIKVLQTISQNIKINNNLTQKRYKLEIMKYKLEKQKFEFEKRCSILRKKKKLTFLWYSHVQRLSYLLPFLCNLL